MMDISPSRVFLDVAAGAGYNTGADKLNIKGVRADAAGILELVDETGKTVLFSCLQGEVLPVQGKIEISTGSLIAVQVFL